MRYSPLNGHPCPARDKTHPDPLTSALSRQGRGNEWMDGWMDGMSSPLMGKDEGEGVLVGVRPCLS